MDDLLVREARGARFHPEPFVVYYARIESADGQTLWTSPVWLDF